MEDIRIQVAVGARIAALRKSQGLDQAGFARMVGLNRSYLAGIESGERNMTLESLSKIVSGFGMSYSDFFDGI